MELGHQQILGVVWILVWLLWLITMTKLMSSELIQEVINMEIALKDGTLHAFEGPINNQAGEEVIAKGQCCR